MWLKVSPIQKQHAVAIDILARLGLDNIKLEPEGNGRYETIGRSPKGTAVTSSYRSA